jgi:hypothetical protein
MENFEQKIEETLERIHQIADHLDNWPMFDGPPQSHKKALQEELYTLRTRLKRLEADE